MEFIYMIWLRIKYKFLMLHQPKKKKSTTLLSLLFHNLQPKHLTQGTYCRTHITKYVDDKSGPTLLCAQADSKAHKIVTNLLDLWHRSLQIYILLSQAQQDRNKKYFMCILLLKNGILEYIKL